MEQKRMRGWGVMKGLFVFLFFFLQIVFFGVGEELVFSVVVVEQGESTPSILFPKAKSEWNQVFYLFFLFSFFLLTLFYFLFFLFLFLFLFPSPSPYFPSSFSPSLSVSLFLTMYFSQVS